MRLSIAHVFNIAGTVRPRPRCRGLTTPMCVKLAASNMPGAPSIPRQYIFACYRTTCVLQGTSAWRIAEDAALATPCRAGTPVGAPLATDGKYMDVLHLLLTWTLTREKHGLTSRTKAYMN